MHWRRSSLCATHVAVHELMRTAGAMSAEPDVSIPPKRDGHWVVYASKHEHTIFYAECSCGWYAERPGNVLDYDQVQRQITKLRKASDIHLDAARKFNNDAAELL